MNKKVGWWLGFFGFLFLFGILLFVGYMYKYQQLINEEAIIADERCLVIKPIIAKKQLAALKYFEVFASSTSAQMKLATSNEVIKYTKMTVTTSAPWMKKQKLFLDKWEFSFFTNEKLKDVFYAQYDKDLANYEGNIALIEYFDKFEDPQYQSNVLKAIKKQDETQTILDKAIKEAEKRFDIRWYFTKVPLSKCKEVPNPFDWHDSSVGLEDSLS